MKNYLERDWDIVQRPEIIPSICLIYMYSISSTPWHLPAVSLSMVLEAPNSSGVARIILRLQNKTPHSTPSWCPYMALLAWLAENHHQTSWESTPRKTRGQGATQVLLIEGCHDWSLSGEEKQMWWGAQHLTHTGTSLEGRGKGPSQQCQIHMS